MANRISPVVINHGKQGRKAVKRLKRGEGTLLQEVEEIVELAKTDLGPQATGKTIVPVVMVYKQKTRRKRGGFGLF